MSYNAGVVEYNKQLTIEHWRFGALAIAHPFHETWEQRDCTYRLVKASEPPQRNLTKFFLFIPFVEKQSSHLNNCVFCNKGLYHRYLEELRSIRNYERYLGND